MTTAEHVVMMVANSVDKDSRVLKEAVAVARSGVRVTLLGVATDGKLAMDSLDGRVVMIRLPAAFPLREARKRRRARRRSRRLPLVGYRLNGEFAARAAAIAARRADLKAASGQAADARRTGELALLRFKAGVAGRVVRQKLLIAAAMAVRLRDAVTRHQNRWFVSAWKAWDDWTSRRERPARWRGVVPEAYDYERIFGRVIDELAPDVLHAHDMHLVGVAARAAGRAKLRGRDLKVVYDAHEYVAGLSRYGARTPQFISAWADHEREYIGRADRVITVSPAIAHALRERYSLTREPTVIINTPNRSEISAEVVDLRTRIGLPTDVPLLVYSGGITRARGVETAIQALVLVPGVHLAIVCVPSTQTAAVRELRALAAALQVEDRVHYLAPVEPDEVVSFLRGADIGLIPILRYPSHEMALPNKVFEYVFAGLPVITSDMPSLTEFVERTGIGVAFEAENAADLADKIRHVLADPAPYRTQVSRPGFQQEVSWNNQVAILQNLYGELLGRELDTPEQRPAGRRMLIGPANTDEQAAAWAHAIERSGAATAESIQAPGSRQFASHIGWRAELGDHLLRNVTQVVFESGRPLLGADPVRLFTSDLPLLDNAGIGHAVVVHGSDVRGASWPVLRDLLASYEGPVLVTEPGLVDGAEWLPWVVEVPSTVSAPPLESAVPVVLKVGPVDSALAGLAEKGLIEYRRDEDALATVDIFVDDLLATSYSVLACRAMAVGRVVVGKVAEQLAGTTPIVRATPEDLGQVIVNLLEEPADARMVAAAGPAYVREMHDGRKSAEVLLAI